MQSTEKWLPVVGYEGLYEVSDHGNVRSLDRTVTYPSGRTINLHGRPLSPTWVASGIGRRLRVKLTSGKCWYVHRLVLTAFVGPCPEGMEGCHNDGDPQNNRLTNLRWDTRSENMIDIVRHGRHNHAHKTMCPLGHKLEHPNLIAAYLRAGGRGCRSCANARKWAKRKGITFTQSLADAYYARYDPC